MEIPGIPEYPSMRYVRYTKEQTVTVIQHLAYALESVRIKTLNLLIGTSENYVSSGISLYAVLKSADLNHKLLNYFLGYVLDVMKHQFSELDGKVVQGIIFQPHLNIDSCAKSKAFKTHQHSDNYEKFLAEQEGFNSMLDMTVLASHHVADPSKYPKLGQNNISLVTLVLYKLYERLSTLNELMFNLLDPKVESEAKPDLFIDLLFHQNMAKEFGKFIYLALKPNHHDLLYSEPDSSRWLSLASYIEVIDVGTEQDIDQQYKTLCTAITMMAGMQSSKPVQEYIMNIKIGMIRNTLGNSDNIEKVVHLFTPKLHTEQLIYAPKLITDFKKVRKGEFKLSNLSQNSKKHRCIVPDVKKYAYDENKHTQIRVLTNGHKLWFDKPCPKESVETIDYAIVHTHGGGFATCSSVTHLWHTKYWADQSKMPVFSIDYRLAPEHPFPNGIEDCFDSYLWLITYGFEQLGIRPKKVYVAGDSAGGNTAANICTLSILNNVPKPDMLVMVYPTLLMSNATFVPSFLYSLDDPILSINLIKQFAEAYNGGNFDNKDYFMSPLNLPDEVMSQFPATRIMVSLYFC